MHPPPPWLLCLGECAIGQIPPVRTWPKPALIRRRRYRRARLRHEAVCLLAQARTKNLLEGLFRRPFAWRAVAVEPQIRYSVDRLHLQCQLTLILLPFQEDVIGNNAFRDLPELLSACAAPRDV